jgi:hypothetical protein
VGHKIPGNHLHCNFHIICEEINAEKWTIILDEENAEAKDRTAPIKELSSHRKWIKVDFIKPFPTMSTLDNSINKKAMKMVVKVC